MALSFVTWFNDDHLETISIRCLFFWRLLSYCKVDIEPNWVLIPNQLQDLEVEAQQIPVIRKDNQIMFSSDIIAFCKAEAKKKEITLGDESSNFAKTILFEWATTNLLGYYVHVLYQDPSVRKRVYKNYLETYKSLTVEDLDSISESMRGWSKHNENIALNSNELNQHIITLLEGFDSHLKGKRFWFGDEINICDIALFSFVYMLYNPELIYFHDEIKNKENLLRWAKEIDQLTRHKYSKLHF